MGDAAIKEWLVGAYTNYKHVEYLYKTQNAESRDEVENILLEMEKEIADFNPEDHELKIQVSVISALLKYQLGKLFPKSIEEAERYFKDSWKFVEDYPLHPDSAYLSICILKELHALSVAQNRLLDVSKYSLKKIIIQERMEFGRNRCVKSFADLFLSRSDEQRKEPLSSLEQLKKKIDIIDQAYADSIEASWLDIVRTILEKNHESLEWSEELITLALSLIRGNKFLPARRVISCAHKLRLKCESSWTNQVTDTDRLNCLHFIKMRIFDCWGVYARALLGYSATTVMFKIEPRSSGALPDYFNNVGLLSKEEVEEFEDEIICTISSYDDAERIYEFAKLHLDFSLSGYTSRKKPTNRTHTTMEICRLNKNFTACVVDTEKKCQIYDYSISLLEDELSKGDNTYEARSDMRLELGENYFNEACIIYKNHAVLSPERHKQCISSARRAAENFKLFLKCCNVKELPRTLPIDNVKRELEACMKLAGAYIIQSTEAQSKTENLSQAFKLYTDIAAYIDRNPEHEIFIQPRKIFLLDVENFSQLIQKIVDSHVNGA